MTTKRFPGESLVYLLLPVVLAAVGLTLSACAVSGSSAPESRAVIYVTNEDDGTVSVIDGATETVAATVTVGSAPRGIATNGVTKKSYVANYGSGTVSVLDGTTHQVLGTITLPGGSNPQMVGVNAKTNKVYVAYEYYADEVEIIDGTLDSVAATYGTSGNYPVGIASNPTSGKIYVVLWGDSSVDVVDAQLDANAGNVNPITSDYGGGIAVNPVTNLVYVPDLQAAGSVAVINGSTDTQTGSVAVGATPSGAAANPNTNMVYVTNFGDNTVSVINGATAAVVATIPVADGPFGVAVNRARNRVYVACRTAGKLSIIDGAANAVTATVPVGANPYYVSVLEYRE
jgi:YVTN family beta-propeller protein